MHSIPHKSLKVQENSDGGYVIVAPIHKEMSHTG